MSAMAHGDQSDSSSIDPQGRHRAVYVISVAAELTGVHPQTLRVYERRGLVAPARTGGMSRRYSEADIEQIQLIQELTSDGLNLAGVKRVIALQHEVEELRATVSQLRAQTRDAKNASTRHDLVPLHQEIMVFQRRD